MKRGEIWTAAGSQAYAGKPRPVVILQDDRFDAIDSVTVCPLTSDPAPLLLFRVPIEPTPENGLRKRSSAMADKIASIPKTRIRTLVGRLNDSEIGRLERAMMVFLGLAG